ncbi:MAG: alpha/beta hydrolase [Solirubrobacteraceae bacterium]|nr:alpha/beta hydrolase [Solirubrobacteraceae bacterium]
MARTEPLADREATDPADPVRERRTSVFGYETRELSVDGRGPAVVMIHGYGDSADTWRPLMRRFAAAGRAAVAIDLPGFGRASRLKRGALLPQWDDFCGAVVEATAKRTGGDVVVAGNSLGGLLTLRLAQRQDLPIAGIMPLAPAGVQVPPWSALLQHDPAIHRVLAMPVPLPRRMVAGGVSQVFRRVAFAEPAAADPQMIEGFTQHLSTRGSLTRLLDIGRALVAEILPGGQPPIAPERITCPTLLVWGTKDRLLAPEGAAVLGEALQHGRTVMLEGCGHCPQLEATDRVMELAEEFLDGLG